MLHATGDLGKSGRVVREEVGYRDASHIKMKTCKPPTIVLLLLCPQLGWFWGEGIEGGGKDCEFALRTNLAMEEIC